MEDYQREGWVSLYHRALTDPVQVKMPGRIEAAKQAIITRMGKLQTLPGLHPAECQAIEDASCGLRALEREDARLTASHTRDPIQRLGDRS